MKITYYSRTFVDSFGKENCKGHHLSSDLCHELLFPKEQEL